MTCEASAGRQFKWNFKPYLLFFKMQQNLKKSSAANFKWSLKGQSSTIEFFYLCIDNLREFIFSLKGRKQCEKSSRKLSLSDHQTSSLIKTSFLDIISQSVSSFLRFFVFLDWGLLLHTFICFCCHLLIFVKIIFFAKFLQEYYQSVKHFESRSSSTFCLHRFSADVASAGNELTKYQLSI